MQKIVDVNGQGHEVKLPASGSNHRHFRNTSLRMVQAVESPPGPKPKPDVRVSNLSTRFFGLAYLAWSAQIHQTRALRSHRLRAPNGWPITLDPGVARFSRSGRIVVKHRGFQNQPPL